MNSILPIKQVAKKYGILEKELELFGEYKAKIKLDILKRINSNKKGKYVVVTTITPTHLGEGKTTTTIGLSLALNKLGKKSFACIRQPSLGPLFGIKGASGGGKAKIIPEEDFNIHLTGDFYNVSIAHNLCMSFLMNAVYRKQIDIDKEKILWKYVFDVSDRFLRNISIGIDIVDNEFFPLNTGFDISASSEIMSILSFSTSLSDLKEKLSKIVLGFSKNDTPITAKDIKVVGAMLSILKNSIKPNLLQTSENTPVFVHTGPFANISHGNSSVIADIIALYLSDYVITESGFGADCGFEKFINIKCRYSGLIPDCVVLVCTIRALKIHSGKIKIFTCKDLPEDLKKENLSLLEEGLCNLKKQIENVKVYGLPVIVAINKFITDTEKEIQLIKNKAREFGADDVAVSEVWLKGSKGGIELAEKVIKISNENRNKNFKFLYPLEISIKEKIFTIATKIYGAKNINYSQTVEEKIRLCIKNGWDKLPVCIAKTQFSLSHNPKLKGVPKNFILPVNDIIPHIGVGFLVVLCGDIKTMPALPSVPIGTKIDVDNNGNVIGLY